MLNSCATVQTINNEPITSKGPLTFPNDPLVDSLFLAGYNFYCKLDYIQALKTFESLHQIDTTFQDYESYAFAADCFKNLGKVKEGSLLYDSLEKSYLKYYQNHTNNFDDLISLDEIRYMKSLYPELPLFLRKENGFVPEDSMPKILHDTAPIYPGYEYFHFISFQEQY